MSIASFNYCPSHTSSETPLVCVFACIYTLCVRNMYSGVRLLLMEEIDHFKEKNWIRPCRHGAEYSASQLLPTNQLHQLQPWLDDTLWPVIMGRQDFRWMLTNAKSTNSQVFFFVLFPLQHWSGNAARLWIGTFLTPQKSKNKQLTNKQETKFERLECQSVKVNYVLAANAFFFTDKSYFHMQICQHCCRFIPTAVHSVVCIFSKISKQLSIFFKLLPSRWLKPEIRSVDVFKWTTAGVRAGSFSRIQQQQSSAWEGGYLKD